MVQKTKIKTRFLSCLYFLCLCPQDTTSFDRLRSTSFFATRKHHSVLATQNDILPLAKKDTTLRIDLFVLYREFCLTKKTRLKATSHKDVLNIL